jgi:hypothetical protein
MRRDLFREGTAMQNIFCIQHVTGQRIVAARMTPGVLLVPLIVANAPHAVNLRSLLRSLEQGGAGRADAG